MVTYDVSDFDRNVLRLYPYPVDFFGYVPGTLFAEAEALSHDFAEVLRRVEASQADEAPDPDPVAWLAGSMYYERKEYAAVSLAWRFHAEFAQCKKELAAAAEGSLAFLLLLEQHRKLTSASTRAYGLGVRRCMALAD